MVDLKNYRYFDIVELIKISGRRWGQAGSCTGGVTWNVFLLCKGVQLLLYRQWGAIKNFSGQVTQSDLYTGTFSFFYYFTNVFSYKLKTRSSTSKKDYGFLYCETCIIAGVWNWTPIPARYACLYQNIILVVGWRASRKGAKLMRDWQEIYLVESQWEMVKSRGGRGDCK